MHTIRTKYSGELRTSAQHIQSGVEIITDAPTDNNGRGAAFSPTDLVCSALGSCMLTLMGIKGGKYTKFLEGLELDITKVMSADPRMISEIHINFHWQIAPQDQKGQDVLQNAALTCPVALSLSPQIKQIINFNFPNIS